MTSGKCWARYRQRRANARNREIKASFRGDDSETTSRRARQVRNGGRETLRSSTAFPGGAVVRKAGHLASLAAVKPKTERPWLQAVLITGEK